MDVKILGRQDLEKVLDMPRVIEGVESVYKLKAEGKTAVWPLVSYNFDEYNAVMDIRSGCVFGENLHGLKMLNNFPLNTNKGLPSFNGMLMIFDSSTGIPLGVTDASYITCMRTGAAGALGAKVLAKPDSKTLFILGAGKQAIYQIAAVLILFPAIKQVYIADVVAPDNARRFAASCADELKIKFGIERKNISYKAVTSNEASNSNTLRACDDSEQALAEAVSKSDIIITITPSKTPVIKKAWISPGAHLSCIGADMEGKEEIEPEIFAKSRVFADDKPQCIRVGEMELAIKGGFISEKDVAGEIGEVLTGKVKGRLSADDITVFDATGLALLDLITGKKAIDAAEEKGLGLTVNI